ncbi:ptzR [Candidatus Endolissoclinum faulkneri L2]|uniref:PtzR n=1 Tax=Candidatus Endolissoclinum faulkneri L2 TaxID=1193729 RepID=K7YSV1_9PROT|nr:ptzR [Candidatus Endolissoclinum faulkneri]AFX99659.1 ptzR [Candidatus Endolissoclinum faulkneri L2]
MNPNMNIPNTFPTQFQDQIVRIFSEKCLTGNLFASFDCFHRLDIDILRRTTRIIMDAEPVIGCRMDLNSAEPIWIRRDDLDAVSNFSVTKSNDVEADTIRLIALPYDLDAVPHFSISLLKGDDYDRLLMRMQHYLVDGRAFFEVAILFAKIYSALVNDITYTLTPNFTSRDSFAWLKSFGWLDRLRIVRRDIGDILRMRKPQVGFKMHNPADLMKRGDDISLALFEVPKSRLLEIDRFASILALTRNDLLLAGFARAYSKLVGVEYKNHSIQLSVPNNVRRYAAVAARPPVCNLSGVANVFIDKGIGLSFSDTIDQLRKEMKRQRTGFMGASNPLTLPFLAKKSFLRKRDMIDKMIASCEGKTMPPTFTNVGRISEQRLRFAGIAPQRIEFYSCPIRKPVILILVMEYRDTLMLSSSHYISDISVEDMNNLLRNTIDEISIS